jgi:type II secretory pathway pseudopilin PulG
MRRQGEAGFSLVELVAAIGIIVVGILAFFLTFYANFGATRSAEQRDAVRVALETTSETLRHHPNFDTLYATYHGTSIPVPEVEAPDGTPARIQITCYVDETTIPAEFGPVLDLDGRPGLTNPDCSGDYELLPVRLRITYVNQGAVETEEVHMMVGPESSTLLPTS